MSRSVDKSLMMTLPYTTTDNAVSSANKTDFDSLPLGQISKWIWVIGLPIIFLLGVFGNVMTILVLRRFRENRSTLDRYFLSLAVTDLCVNVTATLRWWIITVSDLRPYAVHTAICKLGFFFVSTSSTCSAWLVVVMVLHRALSVVWPHRVNVVCTPKISWGIIASVVFIFSAVSIHVLYGFEIIGGSCGPSEQHREFLIGIYLKLDIFLSSLLPFFCLMLSNIVLVVKLRTSVKEASDQFAASDRQQSVRERKVNSITLTALVVSVSFIVFSLPNAVKNLVDFTFLGSGDIQTKAFSYFLQRIVIVFFYLNYSMNFYLYCLTGQRFRKEFLKLMAELVFCIRSKSNE